MQSLQSWIPSIVSILTGIVAIAIAYAVTKTRVEILREDKKKVEDHLETASKELQSAVTAITVLSREQAVINKMTANTLEALTRRVEAQEKQISDLSATVKLLAELVKRLEKINVE